MWRLLLLVCFTAAPCACLQVQAGRHPLTATRPMASRSIAARVGPGAVMQETDGGGGGDGGERERSRGRTTTIARPKPKPKQSSKEEVDKENSWRVLLHNDDVRASHKTEELCSCAIALCAGSHHNFSRSHATHAQVHTFDYVTMAIVKVVKTITRKKAHRITVQCHSAGTATVTTTWKQMAKTMCLKLQKFGLTSSIAPD